MGNQGARFMGLEKAEQTIEESVGGITKKVRQTSPHSINRVSSANLKQLDSATIETTSGGFYSWDGSELQY